MGDGSGCYAHTLVGEGDWHDLVSHLHETADRACKDAPKFEAGKLAYLAGLWQDLGKFNLKKCEKAKREGLTIEEKSPGAYVGK